MAQVPKQSKRLTMVEIAKEAGVSTTTVSKVLNQLPGVGAQTRARIQQVVEQNDYVQNHAARHLRKGQSGLVDLVIMPLEGGYDLGVPDFPRAASHWHYHHATPSHHFPRAPGRVP